MSTAEVPLETVQKWQEIVNIIAEIVHVPSALVMKVEPPNIKVFVSSESNSNPYERNELAPLNTGLYCETVMETRRSLLVPDALLDEEWNSNPDIKLGMISYLGFPVSWPDGRIFGTICVLDRMACTRFRCHLPKLIPPAVRTPSDSYSRSSSVGAWDC